MINEERLLSAFSGIKNEFANIQKRMTEIHTDVKNFSTKPLVPESKKSILCKHKWAVLERIEGTHKSIFGRIDNIIKYLYSCSYCGLTRQEIVLVPKSETKDLDKIFKVMEEHDKRLKEQNAKMDKILEMAAFEEEAK